MTPPVLTTERLRLRQWCPADAEPWAALTADPLVMEHFPAPLSRSEADAFIERASQEIDDRGWGWFAVELRADPGLIGTVALSPVTFDPPGPATEIGWRFARSAWGQGYATEAAAALLDLAFTRLALPQVVSFTTTTNGPSEAVMRRLGMSQDPTTPVFDHPALPPGHPLRAHVLYRISAEAWLARGPHLG